MADPKGFMTTPREVAERGGVAERVHDWNEVYPVSPGAAVRRVQSARIISGLPRRPQRLIWPP